MLVLHEKPISDFQTSVTTKIEITITCNHHQNLNNYKIQPSFNPIISETSIAHTNKIGHSLSFSQPKNLPRQPKPSVFTSPFPPKKYPNYPHSRQPACCIYLCGHRKIKKKIKNCTRTFNFIQSVLILAVRLGPRKSL